MKILLTFLLVILTSVLLAQQQQPYKYYLSALKGLEDTNGNTHLIYTKYEAFKNKLYPEDNTSQTVFDYNISDKRDKPIFSAVSYYSIPVFYSTFISDFEFWDNDPSKYIYCGTDTGMDPVPFLRRYDNKPLSSPGSLNIYNIEISRQNDSILYYSTRSIHGPGGWLFKSTDYGVNWTSINEDFALVSLNPYNDKVVFGMSKEGYLIKSFDGGLTSTIVDTVKTNYWSADLYKFAYDKGTSYIYRIVNNALFVSGNSGGSFSWKLNYSGKGISFQHDLLFSVDTKKAGRIYIASDKNIFISEDHGSSFKKFGNVGRNIIGFYAKPGSDIVYAATSYEIYEVTKDSAKIIKQLSIPSGLLDYYPLAKGNKWIYSEFITDEHPGQLMTREVTGDTLMPDNKKYFIIKEFHPYHPKYISFNYERIDSVSGKVYTYIPQTDLPEKVFLLDDLSASLRDTIYSNRFRVPSTFTSHLKFRSILYSDTSIEMFGRKPGNKKFRSPIYPAYNEYQLTEGFGLSRILFEYDLGYTLDSLVGCTINGIKYGDSLTVGVNDEVSSRLNYSLSQNFPNPFNPITQIKFSIMKPGHVTLKVYNIIGQEVATLVNETLSSGGHKVNFNASHLPSGIYIYSIKAGTYIESRKMLLLK